MKRKGDPRAVEAAAVDLQVLKHPLHVIAGFGNWNQFDPIDQIDVRIMARHVLPNAMVATLTFLPFILNSAVVTLTSLDFIGFGLPPDAPSLGRLVGQGKANLHAPWIGISVFATLTLMLTLLVFIGEAVRDAFDTRKFLQ